MEVNMDYIRIVNIETGVINTVDKDRGIRLIKTGEYQEFPDEVEKKKPAGRPKKEA